MARLARRELGKIAEAAGGTSWRKLVLRCDSPIAIANDDHVWRQIKDNDDYRLYDFRRGVFRIRVENTKTGDNALRFDSDGLSVFWKEHLALHGLGHSALVAANQLKPLIFEAEVGAVRALRPDNRRIHVVYTPQDSEPIGCAHASILPGGLSTKGKEVELMREKLESVLIHRHGKPSGGPLEGT